MPYQNINSTLSAADKTLIFSQIATIKSLLPFLVNLTPKEIIKLGSLKTDKILFMKTALETVENNPGIFPPIFNITHFKNDIELLESLESIKRQMGSLMESLNDTTLAVRAEAMKSSLSVFGMVKLNKDSNVEGIDAIIDSLSNAYGTKGKAGRKKTNK